GARDTQALATERVAKLLASFREPPIDPEVRAALAAFVAERKASMPDAFV
ncbi:MAG: trimethylamine methyltransferase family protein, partial [Maritimibacter sp.]|nr:trimethylamine methyltransferase family protein [Maritimibacter sp.]